MIKNKQIGFIILLNSLVRHALKNLITAINGYNQLLIEPCTEEEKASYTKEIAIISKRINDQLEFWKTYESDGCENSWQYLKDIYNHAKDFLPNIKITLDEGMGDVKVFTNSLASKVLENLVDNSIRHGEKVTEIKISYQIDPNGNFIFIYEDNGVGVELKDKKRIFERGFGKNTGMGLYLSKEILDITDIKIFEVGEPGKGVRFEIIVTKDHYELPKKDHCI